VAAAGEPLDHAKHQQYAHGVAGELVHDEERAIRLADNPTGVTLDSYWDYPGWQQRWTGTRSCRGTAPAVEENTGRISGGEVARAATLVLPPGSRSGSKISQAAHQPRLGTLENQLFSTNPSDKLLY
jgi:hypothetical protein